MNIHGIETDSMLNGDGLRVVLWVSGCNHHCKGCQNPQTHDPKSGFEFTEKELVDIFNSLKYDYISGLTLSGGDPLFPANRAEITSLCRSVKIYFPRKTIWCYTGYMYEDVKDLEVMKYIDVLVEGPFIEKLKDVNYPWAGSTNQRIMRLKDGKQIDA